MSDNMNFLDKFGIKIDNLDLIEEALTHSSYSNEHNTKNYERLEFLGDAVLQLITSEYFYRNFDAKEGELSKIRASFVCESALAQYSKDVGIDKHIKVGNGQIKNINDTIIADCFESVLGAIYLDKGFEVAKKYVLEVLSPHVNEHHIFLGDYKSRLQEMVQTDKKSLEYRLVSETGPSHDKTFVYEVVIDNIVYGKGIGKSKKEAEQEAAKNALEKSVK
ncbi:MAG: ribonuclease III [Firmicutes bacterium]|nr:ribonuclease III [Bacillota bacterium]